MVSSNKQGFDVRLEVGVFAWIDRVMVIMGHAHHGRAVRNGGSYHISICPGVSPIQASFWAGRLRVSTTQRASKTVSVCLPPSNTTTCVTLDFSIAQPGIELFRGKPTFRLRKKLAANDSENRLQRTPSNCINTTTHWNIKTTKQSYTIIPSFDQNKKTSTRK